MIASEELERRIMGPKTVEEFISEGPGEDKMLWGWAMEGD